MNRAMIEKEFTDYFDNAAIKDFGCEKKDAIDFAEFIVNKLTGYGEYEKIEATLGDLPTTWYPALIKAIIVGARKKGVFPNGNPVAFIEKVLVDIVMDGQ